MEKNINKSPQQEEGQFFKLHKALFEGELKKLSVQSKMVYALLSDRHKLSIKNKWADDKGQVYVIYSRDKIGEMLNCSRKTAGKYMKELVEIGLIKERGQGANKPKLIYVTPISEGTGTFYPSEPEGREHFTHQDGNILPTSKTEVIKTENIYSATEIAQHTSTTKDPITNNKVKDTDKVNEYFESLWTEYPSKKGKARVSQAKRKELHKLGEEMERCIKRYSKDVEDQRANGFKELKFQNGGTFFNTGYIDYLDVNFKAEEESKKSNVKGMNIPLEELEALRKLKAEQKKKRA